MFGARSPEDWKEILLLYVRKPPRLFDSGVNLQFLRPVSILEAEG